MSRLFGSVRLASILAVAAALILTSVAAGAAGAALILGQANSSGSAATSVTSSNASRTLLVQNSSATGFAIDARSTGGIGGQFLSSTSTGMAGYTSANNRNGVVGTHNGTAFGGGAAVLADGRQNHGLSGTTGVDDADAVRGVNVATDADYLSGLYANGVYGESRAQHSNGVYGLASAASGFGYGVWGQSASPDGAGVTGETLGGGLAGLFFGDVQVNGALTVASCTGCTAAATVAQASTPLAQGDPVAIAGVTTNAAGDPVLLVRQATTSDRVIGVANTTVTYRASPRGGSRLVTGAPGAAEGAFVTVVTGGLMAYDAPAALGVMAAGAGLAVGSGGDLASAGSGTAVAFVAGTLSDGRLVLFVNP